jgi:hypothetical protein
MIGPFEFIVDGYDIGQHFTVIGCAGDQLIRIGDEFDALYRYKRPVYPHGFGDEPVRVVEKPVSLRVVCIHSYGKSLEMLGQGMTGSLALEGQGYEQITTGWVLGRREPSETAQATTEAATSIEAS